MDEKRFLLFHEKFKLETQIKFSFVVLIYSIIAIILNIIADVSLWLDYIFWGILVLTFAISLICEIIAWVKVLKKLEDKEQPNGKTNKL